MSTGNYLNKDGLAIQFGTSKANTENWGDYVMYGTSRVCEGLIDLTTLTTAAPSAFSTAIQSLTTLFGPAGGAAGSVPGAGGNSNTWFIEHVELIVETAATTSTSATLKVGLVELDMSTVPSNYDHALINAETNAAMATVGDCQIYVGADSVPAGSTHGGTLIGSTPAAATGPYYITAQTGTGTFTAGKVRVRIFYRGIGTITQ